MSPTRRGTGRKKIPIQKIECAAPRQVTFSKRRTGLFKKAKELCILCGAQVAIIVFSPAGRAYTFGYPTSVDSVIGRFLRETSSNSTMLHGSISEFKQEEEEVPNQETTGGISSEQCNGGVFKAWWDSPIDDLGLQELQRRKCALEDLKSKVQNRLDKSWLSLSL